MFIELDTCHLWPGLGAGTDQRAAAPRSRAAASQNSQPGGHHLKLNVCHCVSGNRVPTVNLMVDILRHHISPSFYLIKPRNGGGNPPFSEKPKYPAYGKRLELPHLLGGGLDKPLNLSPVNSSHKSSPGGKCLRRDYCHEELVKSCKQLILNLKELITSRSS